jgi:hypothetical protein
MNTGVQIARLIAITLFALISQDAIVYHVSSLHCRSLSGLYRHGTCAVRTAVSNTQTEDRRIPNKVHPKGQTTESVPRRRGGKATPLGNNRNNLTTEYREI